VSLVVQPGSIVIDSVVLYKWRQSPRKCAATIAFWVRKWHCKFANAAKFA